MPANDPLEAFNLPCPTPRILFIDMNSFFASVEQQENPHLRNKPMIVAPIVTDSTCAISASYEARALGIKTGTMVRDAKILCPNLLVAKAQPRLYVKYHDALVGVLEHYFSSVQVLSVDEMACTLGYRHQDGRKAAELAKKIKQHIYSSLGSCLRCSIGIAPNVFLAKVASDFQKPDGLTVFEGDYTPLLFQNKLTDLPGIAKKIAIRLQDKNINTVSDLWNASKKELHLAWGGVIGARWFYMLRGSLEVDYGMYEQEEKKSVGHSHVLPPEFRSRSGAQDIILKLVSKALKRLRSYRQEAKIIAIAVTYRHRQDFHKKCRWEIAKAQHVATNDDLFWIPKVDEWCREIPITDEFYPVKASICFYGLSKYSTQQTMFTEDRSKFIKLFDAVDKINGRYGPVVCVARVSHLEKHAPFRISFGKPGG